MGWIASYLYVSEPNYLPRWLLFAELIKEIAKNVVAHYTAVGKRLALGVKDSRGCLVDVVNLPQCDIFLNHGVYRAALHQTTHLGHFGGRQYGRYGAIHVAVLLPLFLVLKQGLLDGLEFTYLCRSPAVLRRYLRMRVHGQREVAVNQINFAGADVIVH